MEKLAKAPHPRPEIADFVAKCARLLVMRPLSTRSRAVKAGEPRFFATENGRTVGTKPNGGFTDGPWM
jgi:hypothetical protein